MTEPATLPTSPTGVTADKRELAIVKMLRETASTDGLSVREIYAGVTEALSDTVASRAT